MKSASKETLNCYQSGSLEELVYLWQTQPYTNNSNLTDYRKLIQSNPALELVLGLSPCLSWILDVRTQKFNLVSNNVEQLLGYKASSFRKYGLAYLNELIHPEDRKTVWRRTTDLWKNMQIMPVSQRQSYCFNRNYRLRRANGEYIYLLEQTSVLQTDANGVVTHLLSVFSDVTDLIKKDAASISAKSVSPIKVTLKDTYDKSKSEAKLSKRERQIVKLVAEGYSSKVIADQLFISYHTVNTHRRNIIEKTHSRNTSGLVQFAISNCII